MKRTSVVQIRKEYENILAPEDVFILLATASGKSKEFLLAHPEYELTGEEETRAREFFARRIRREPVAYIVGEKEFFGLPFRVTRDTLIPRPETEQLVELTLNEIESRITNPLTAIRVVFRESHESQERKILVADIGTGSGAIIISIASGLKKRDSQFAIRNSQFVFHATDISQAAIVIAKENAQRNGVDGIVSFHEGDLLEPVKKHFDGADEIILTANLPYLSRKLYDSTPEDVKGYEPESALLAEEDGLALYRKLLESLKSVTGPAEKRRRVTGFLEISPEQKESLESLFRHIYPEGSAETIPDLAGKPRVFSFSVRLPEKQTPREYRVVR